MAKSISKVFCDKTPSILTSNSKVTNISEGTILLISKVVEFLKIVNIRSLYGDISSNRDSNRTVVNYSDHKKLAKFIEMSTFAKKFASKTSKRVECLTKDTINSSAQSYNGLVELSAHLLSINHQYVMLGSFTTDSL